MPDTQQSNHPHFSKSIIALVVVIAVVAVGIFFFVPNKKFPSVTDVAKTHQAQQQKVADIVKSGDILHCSEAKGIVIGGMDYATVCRNNIIWKAAQSSTDFNACNGLDNKSMSIADCQHLVLVNLVNKEKNLAVCDSVPQNLKINCADYYWSMQARDAKDPRICVKSSSPQVATACEYNLLLSNDTFSKNPTLSCSLFSDAPKNDCLNYQKRDCGAIRFPPLAQQCNVSH